MKEGEVATLCHVHHKIASHSQLQCSIASTPNEPGVYRWKDAHGNVIYVGKAKNLRKRLQSYIRAAPRGREAALRGPWRRALRTAIADVDVTVTDSELDALILETNLIKEFQPKYNVLMKDGKNYLFVRIRAADPFPSVTCVRRIVEDGAQYFGPYLSIEKVEHILDMLNTLYAFRACEQSIDRLNKAPGTASVSSQARRGTNAVPCLEYQIGRCCGLCAGILQQEEYRGRIEQVMHFLRGNQEGVRTLLKTQMKTAATEKKFERAAMLRNFLYILGDTPKNSITADTTKDNIDIVGIAIQGGHTHVVILVQRGGRMCGDYHLALEGSAESPANALEQFLPQYYGEGQDIPPLLLLPMSVQGRGTLERWLSKKSGATVRIRTPERGRKSRLLQLAEKNAMEKARHAEGVWEAEKRNTAGALRELQRLLHLAEPPHRIEGYDISHLSGTETVGSMVVTIDGRVRNEQYRSFTIRTLKDGAIDDYAALREVLARRLRHLVDRKRKNRIGKKKGFFLITRQKRGKTYIIIDQQLEQYYAENGFRHVLKIAPVLEKKVKNICRDNPKIAPPLVMVYDALQHKPDRSLASTPDLLVIDGGKGQLSAALSMLREAKRTIPVVALAKRDEELFVPGARRPLPLPKDSPALFLLMRLRDEAHRFANRHREKRIRNHLLHPSPQSSPNGRGR